MSEEGKRGLLQRRVEGELLDELEAGNPLAVGSRKDLERLNGLMGHQRLIARELSRILRLKKSARIADLGSGDGRFLLSIARRLGGKAGAVSLVLVDSAQAVGSATEAEFRARGWAVQNVACDVLEWLSRPGLPQFDIILANLFLHHFPERELRQLLGLAARVTRAFVAAEPRRSGLALACSRLVGFIGCNSITRHDAPISVRAGFLGAEISGLWPARDSWEVREGESGFFSHYFVAWRRPDFARTPTRSAAVPSRSKNGSGLGAY